MFPLGDRQHELTCPATRNPPHHTRGAYPYPAEADPDRLIKAQFLGAFHREARSRQVMNVHVERSAASCAERRADICRRSIGLAQVAGCAVEYLCSQNHIYTGKLSSPPLCR
ncbi:MAG: hypothetical protein JWL96_2277 [Sphingomonas bacterium]|nr:hypothetical protein [Sphingomonas bacterium]